MNAPETEARDLLRPAFVNLVLAHVLFGASISMFLILPKHLATSLGAGATEIGLVMSMFSLANVIASRPARHWIQRFGRKRSLAMGILLSTVGGMGFALVTRVGVIAVLARFVQGLGWAVIFTAAYALVVDLAPPGRVAQAIGVFSGGILATNAFGPVASEALLGVMDHRLVWILASLSGLMAFLPLRRVPDPGPRTIEDADLGRAPEEDRLPARVRLVPIVIFAWFTMGLVTGTVGAFQQPLALQRGVTHVSIFWVGFTISAVLVRIVSGRLLDQLGHRRIAGVMGCVYALALITLIFAGPVPLIVSGLAIGLAHGSLYPSLLAFCLHGAPSESRPDILAQSNVWWHTGALSVLVLGPVAKWFGYPTLFVIVSCAILGAGCVLLRTRKPAFSITA